MYIINVQVQLLSGEHAVKGKGFFFRDSVKVRTFKLLCRWYNYCFSGLNASDQSICILFSFVSLALPTFPTCLSGILLLSEIRSAWLPYNFQWNEICMVTLQKILGSLCHVDLIHLWSDSPLFINFSLVGCTSLHIVFPYCLSLHHPPGWRSTREHTLDSGSSFGFGQNYGSRSFSEQPDYCLEVHLYKTAWGCILLSMICVRC